jgi:hypothetical protein
LFDRGCSVAITSNKGVDAYATGLLVLLLSDEAPDLPADDERASDEVIRRLEESGVLLLDESLTGGEGI